MYSLLTVLRVVYAILFGLSSKLPTFIFIFISKAVSLGKYMSAHLAFD